MNLNLENKVALVTGGGRDIGKLISLNLAAEKVSVAVNYNSSPKEAEETVSTIKKLGGNAKAYKGDISNYDEIKNTIEMINKDFGDIDFLINNAGYTRIERFLQSKPEEWDKQIDICLKGSINCCHLVIEKMIAKKNGRIINIVGDSSRIGEANLAITAAARGGTIALGKSLAKELGRYAITVNTISLGLVKTSHSNNDFLEKNMEKILKSYPLKRIGEADDVAPMVTFLCSSNANWITGQVISINGGFCMV